MKLAERMSRIGVESAFDVLVRAHALEAKDYSQEALWGYNVEYMTTHGYQMASFEVLRRYLQTLTNEQINYGMKHFLSEEDIRAISERRHPEFNRTQMMNPILRTAQPGLPDDTRGLRRLEEDPARRDRGDHRTVQTHRGSRVACTSLSTRTSSSSGRN